MIDGGVPVVVPAGSDFGHAVLAVGVLGFGTAGIAEGTAADGVDADEEDEDDDVQDGKLVPVPPHLLQNARLA